MIFIDLLTKLQVTYGQGQGPCDAFLLNAICACTDNYIMKALLGIPSLATQFNNAVSEIKVAIGRGNEKDRPVIVAFVTRTYASLQDTQRQRLEEQWVKKTWKVDKSVVIQFMHFIIPQIEKWVKESTH
jgi:hypothetical protein